MSRVHTVARRVSDRAGRAPRLRAVAVLLAALPAVAGAATWGVRAEVNRAADPHGRIVDVTFAQPVSLTAPWDRFRFAVDVVQPLTRESGAFLGDLDGDGVRDLLLASWDGSLLHFPGLAGRERVFGAGALLRHTVAAVGEDPFEFASAGYLSGAVGDLDGDGVKEVVVGRDVFRNVGAPPSVLLDAVYRFEGLGGSFDATVSLGDLDGDGDLDAVVTYNYFAGDAHVFWNTSTSGSFSFTRQLIADTPLGWQPDNRLAVGDLDGDGLLDLTGAAGIYRNTGTPAAPVWDVFAPSPWRLAGGPPWAANDDLGTNVFLVDADSDGDLDVYASGVEDTVWQVLYYRNVGTAASHDLVYAGPVVVRGSPASIAHRGSDFPSLTASRANPVAADVDGDGRVDLTIGGASFYAGAAILWDRALSPRHFTYPDLHTWPALANVDDFCGGSYWTLPDALCRPPTDIVAWRDADGDGAADALVAPASGIGTALSFYPSSGGWPFDLANRPAPYNSPHPLLTAPGGVPVQGLGVAFADVDADGTADLVTGWEDGTLQWYRNSAPAGLSLADPVPLADASGTPIDVGDEVSPAALDLDGDGDLDFLAATDAGPVRTIMCVTPGQADGYALGGWLAAGGQDPFDVTGVIGGGYNGLSLLAIDHDGDGLTDVVAGDHAGRVWVLRNAGTAQAPAFDVEPLSVSHTAAAYLEVLGPTTIRLRFGLPVIPGEATLTYYRVPGSGGPESGTTPVRVQAPRRRLRGAAGGGS